MALNLNLPDGARRYVALGGGVLLVLGAMWFLGDCGGSDQGEGVEIELNPEEQQPDVYIPEGHEWLGDWTSLLDSAKREVGAAMDQELVDWSVFLASADKVTAVHAANFAKRFGSDEDSSIPAGRAADPAGFGVHDYGEKRVHLSLDRIAAVAQEIGMPELQEREVAFAALCEVLAAAVIDHRHSLVSYFAAAESTSPEAVEVAEAVLAGHVLAVAAIACEATAQQRGLEILGAARQKLQLDAAFRYELGRDFVSAVSAAKNREGVSSLYERPPRTRVEILRPDWFLNPSSRPAYGYEMDAALDHWVDAMREIESELRFRPRTRNAEELGAAYAMLGPEAADELTQLVRISEVRDGVTPGGSATISATLSVLRSAKDAERYVELVNRASDLIDEQLQDSDSISVVGVTRRDLPSLLGFGTDVRKDVRTGGLVVPVRVLTLQRGELVLEVVLSNLQLAEGKAEAILDATLDAAVLGS